MSFVKRVSKLKGATRKIWPEFKASFRNIAAEYQQTNCQLFTILFAVVVVGCSSVLAEPTICIVYIVIHMDILFRRLVPFVFTLAACAFFSLSQMLLCWRGQRI